MHEFEESRLGRLKAALIIALVRLMMSAAIVTFARQGLGHPMVLLLNRFATRSAAFDNVIVALRRLDLLKGAVLMAGSRLV